MVKVLTILTVIATTPVLGIITVSAEIATPDPVKMQRHVEEVIITHPDKYQEMLEKAGGTIKDCLSCHSDLKTSRDLSEINYPRYPGRKR